MCIAVAYVNLTLDFQALGFHLHWMCTDATPAAKAGTSIAAYVYTVLLKVSQVSSPYSLIVFP